ncbi:MAG: hypothetical protein DRJ61_18400 [Acidobacteria bacterium]|nr:MAG: hypothetical protein DRJ61_18400 [Acidobacteriota bacterium]
MLNPDETIILTGNLGSGRLMVGFHPEPGNYRAYVPPGFEVEEGTQWEFFCPVCGQSLKAEIAPRLCALDMVSAGARHRVYFSRTAGEKATFVISAEDIEPHGIHAERHSLEMLELL